MTRMVEVNIDSVRVSLTNQQRIVVLREANADRYLPIWIGPYEAEAITISLQEIEVSRPQTHDLLKNLLNHLQARLVRVEVLSLKDDVFYGNLVLDVNGEIINIDSRPSDALALAVRAHAPILVSVDVLEKAGIEPDRDLQDQGESEQAIGTTPPTSKSPAEAAPEPDDRLSIFEDFLDQLDIEGLDENDEDSEDQDEDQDQE